MYKDFNISDDGYNDQQVRFNRDIYGMNIGDKKIETTLYRFLGLLTIFSVWFY